MLFIGLSWILFWVLVKVFTVDFLLAAVATGIVFVALGLIRGDFPTTRR
jgi:hypothetical protein